MYFYGKKIFAVSQKEDAVTKKKNKKNKKKTQLSPQAPHGLFFKVSARKINRFRWSLLPLTP